MHSVRGAVRGRDRKEESPMNTLDFVDQASLRDDIPAFGPGDTVNVHVKVIERTFPVHSPNIDKVEVLTRGDVRRAKLYYLRDLRGKKAKIKEKR